jgi:hypothetical protein
MFLARYELDFYGPEDGILHSHRRENLKSCIELFCRRRKVFPVRYELCFYIQEDGVLHSSLSAGFLAFFVVVILLL